jgi:hypothetical protein
MGVGHLAIGLMLKRADPGINLGLLFFLVFLSDFLLGVFYYAGMERAIVPGGFSDLHYLTFNFPYSHGLVASFIWSALTFGLAFLLWRKGDKLKAALVMAFAVFSHFILDAMVHVPGLPVVGENSQKIGLRLWENMTLALTLEMMLVVIGIVLYLGVANKNFRGRWGVPILVVIFALLTIMGMTSSEAPEMSALGIGWLVIPPVTGTIAYWLDRKGAVKA